MYFSRKNKTKQFSEVISSEFDSHQMSYFLLCSIMILNIVHCYICIYPKPPQKQDRTQGHFLNSLTGLKLVFLFFERLLSPSICHAASMDLPKLSLSASVSYLSLPVWFPGYRSVVDNFLLVILRLRVRVKRSIRERHLWVRPYSSSSVPHVFFV